MHTNSPSLRALALGALMFSALDLPCAAQALDSNPALDLQGFQPLQQADGTIAPEARGSWRTRGYGFRFELDTRRIELLCETKSFVYRMPKEASSFLGDALFRQGEEPDTLLATAHPSGGWWVLDRCAPAKGVRELDGPWTPQERLQVFAETMDEHYAFFELWGVDWKARWQEEAARIGPESTDAELFEACARMLAGIDDAHFGFAAPVDGSLRSLSFGKGPTKHRLRELFEAQDEYTDLGTYFNAWYRDYLSGIEQTLLHGEGTRGAGGRLRWGWLDEEVGYLHLTGMGGYGAEPLMQDLEILERDLDRALGDLEDASALVLDVSYNRGGVDLFGWSFAGRFADQKRLAYIKRPTVPSDHEHRAFVTPSPRLGFDGPLVVVTSDITMSAAESFVLYMRALPQVTLAGQPSRGAFSDVLEKPLPHGMQLMLSNEVYVTPEGECYEGRGIPVEVPLKVFDPIDPWGSHVRAIGKAKELALAKANGER